MKQHNKGCCELRTDAKKSSELVQVKAQAQCVPSSCTWSGRASLWVCPEALLATLLTVQCNRALCSTAASSPRLLYKQ
jgi:hypothetical protein